MSNWSPGNNWSHPTNPPPPTSRMWYGCACSGIILVAHTGGLKADKPSPGAVEQGFYLYPEKEGGEGTYYSLHGYEGNKMMVKATAWQPMPEFPDKILYWVEVTADGKVKVTPPDDKAP